jgi:putative spermidine/putrescine transport system ATP-binding protein
VLLLDEPLSNLDAKLRQEMKTEIRQLQKSLDLTTIFVTHDQDEALSVSDRLVVMSAGHVEQIGTPRQIFEHPSSEFVADFMGFSNLIPITLSAGGGTLKSGMPIRIEGTSGSAGSRVLALRSEHLSLRAKPADSPDNTAPVAVEALTYRGSFVDYAVRLDDGTPLLVRGDAEKLFTPGDRAYVAWNPAAGAILQRAAAAAA